MALRYENRMVGPDEAERLLLTQPKNRPVNFSRVLTFANDMRIGAWENNGEPIIISETGKLIDGQHRLYAIRETECVVELSIISGVKDSVFDTIDSGASRGVQDIVALAGHTHSSVVSSSAANLWRLWHDLPARTKCPPHVVLGVISRFPALHKWAPFMHVKNALPAAAHLLALVYLEDIARKPQEAERFHRAMSKGDGLAIGDPLLTLRNRALTEVGRSTGRHIWEGVARVIDAMEHNEVLQRLLMPVGEPNTMRRPAEWVEHVKTLPMSYRLDAREFLPPDVPTLKRRGEFRAWVEEVRETAEAATGVKASPQPHGAALPKAREKLAAKRQAEREAKIMRETHA